MPLQFFFFQAEDGIRDLVRSRGLGDVYKRQIWGGYYSHGSTGKTWTPKIKLGEKAGSPSSVTVDLSLIHI